MVDKLFVHGDARNLTSGLRDISRSNKNSSLQLEVHSNLIRVGIGVNMGVHGSDVDHWSEGVLGHVYTSPNL